MKRLVYILFALCYLFFVANTAAHAQASPACSISVLHTRYSVYGQGTYLGQPISTVGYVSFDGNGNVAATVFPWQPAARLFQSVNNQITDTNYTGTYDVAATSTSYSCGIGTLVLTSSDGSQVLHFKVWVGDIGVAGLNSFSNGFSAIRTDPGFEEVLYFVRLVDPADACDGVAGNLSFSGTWGGTATGQLAPGITQSSLVQTVFPGSTVFGSGPYTETDITSTAGYFTKDVITGTYTLDTTDCTLSVTRNWQSSSSGASQTSSGADSKSQSSGKDILNSSPKLLLDKNSLIWRENGASTGGISTQRYCIVPSVNQSSPTATAQCVVVTINECCPPDF